MDPELTELAQQSNELNFISQCARAGAKRNKTLSRTLAL